MSDWFSPSSGQRPQQPRPPQPQRPPHPQPPQSQPHPQQPPPPPQHRAVHPDHQVWPPVLPQREPAGSSTQPLPAVPSAGPLPRRSPHPAGPPEPPGPPAGPPTEEAAAEPPPKRPRLLLQGVGAIVALAVAIGAPTYDRYLLFQSGQPTDRVHAVTAGQSITFEHVTWKVSYGTMTPPAGTRHNTPDKQWLKIAITRTAADKDGAQLAGQPEVLLKDRAGRAWQLETFEDTAPSDHVVGESYVTTKVAVVPSAVAKEVELELRPSSYRADTPTEDLMKPTADDDDDVLRFRR